MFCTSLYKFLKTCTKLYKYCSRNVLQQKATKKETEIVYQFQASQSTPAVNESFRTAMMPTSISKIKFSLTLFCLPLKINSNTDLSQLTKPPKSVKQTPHKNL